MLDDAARVFRSRDPLDAESFTSTLSSLWSVGSDTRSEMGLELVDYLAVSDSPTAAVLLHALAQLSDEPVRRAAADAARGKLLPAWARQIGAAQFVEGWRFSDVYGDQDALLARYTHPGGAEHALVALVDHNMNGALKDAWLTAEWEQLVGAWHEQASGGPDSPMRPAAELAKPEFDMRVQLALAEAEAFGFETPVEGAQLREHAPLLFTRTGGYEVELRPVDERAGEWSDEQLDALSEQFAASEHHSGGDPVLAQLLVDGKMSLDREPLRWSPIVVEIVLTDWLPRHIELSDEQIEQLPEVLRAFVRFAGERSGLDALWVDETLEAIDPWLYEFRRAMRDPERWSKSKRMVHAMRADGVDPADEQAVAAWIDRFNSLSTKERIEIVG